MSALGLTADLIDSGRLAISEAATNAFTHAVPEPGRGPIVAPELWIYASTWPTPRLVVSVFDGLAAATPHRSGEDLMAESGKGIGIIEAITTSWGCRRSRSRLAGPLVNGKAVWFTLPLPEPWPGRRLHITPPMAAQALHQTLAARGIRATRHDDARVSMLELPTVNVWIEPKHYAWQPRPGHQIRHPLLDLQEAADQLIDYLVADGA
jgi:hypothetical protein